MHEVHFLKYKGYGKDVKKAFKLLLTAEPKRDWIIRWGSRKVTDLSGTSINTTKALKVVSNKGKFRSLLSSNNVRVPPSGVFPMVVRPLKHTCGKHFYVAHNEVELVSITSNLGTEWYASELIDKSAEYRVFCVQGRVVNVSQKIPHDPSKPIWNVATGNCEFVNVKWGDWPIGIVYEALKAFWVSGLDFGAVDVIVDTEGTPYVLEVNSAPALPLLSDGSISYRTKCLAAGINYIIETDIKNGVLIPASIESWKDIIHPALLSGE